MEGGGGHKMGRPEEFPREEQVSPEAKFFFHLIPKAYLSVHISHTEASFQDTNAEGYDFLTNLQITCRKSWIVCF